MDRADLDATYLADDGVGGCGRQGGVEIGCFEHVDPGDHVRRVVVRPTVMPSARIDLAIRRGVKAQAAVIDAAFVGVSACWSHSAISVDVAAVSPGECAESGL